jgi:8-oxo-dGTP pyrophosphatase MutT (NUDIX family)
MSLLDRINECAAPDMSAFTPWRVGGKIMGWVRRDVAEKLRAYPSVFSAASGRLDLMAHLESFDQRSAALNEVAKALADHGILSGWRNEQFGVSAGFHEPPVARLERAAIPLFGVRAFGVHVNGYVRDGEEIRLWVGRRAQDRAIEPGKLDHLVAGGLSFGMSARATLLKEAQEEAGISPDLAGRARSVGAIRYRMLHQGWLRNDTLFIYDLELPAEFTPRNGDGEIAEFELMDLERVESILSGTRDFKFNVSLVVIDFLIRHGHIKPDRSDYSALALAMWRDFE